MSQNTILAIKLDQRSVEATRVQEILTKYGCLIRTRFGIHNGSTAECSDQGLIILDLTGKSSDIENLKNDLLQISGLTVNSMEI